MHHDRDADRYAAKYLNEAKLADFKAYRKGDWIILEYKGKRVYRRYSRDRSLVAVVAQFGTNVSPRHERKVDRYTRYAASRRLKSYNGGFSGGLRDNDYSVNKIRIPIQESE